MNGERLAALLDAESRAIGVALTADQTAIFLRYLTLITRWNPKARLTALTDPKHVVRLHFVDSLLCLTAEPVRSAATLIDVGSGAGLPGIPLAIARPDLQATLLEPAARKAAFLELAVTELHLSCTVIAGRAETAGHSPTLREHFDAVVARAVAPLSTLLEWTLPFVRIGGAAVLLKGPSVDAEVLSASGTAARLGAGELTPTGMTLPGGERRVLVIAPKVAPTPSSFPRKTRARAR